MSDVDKSVEEIMQEYRDENKLFCLEGDRGLEALNKICREIGYKEQCYRHGTSLEEFLRDNPGCCESIIEWITEQLNKSPEWKEALSFEDAPEEPIEEEYPISTEYERNRE